MKKLILALLVGVCLVRVFAVGNFRTVNSISELVSTNNNPKNILTNYFVVDVSRMFAWFNTATNTTNTTTVFESLYVKNILGTNIGRFLQVFSNSLEGATVTNLTVITQTVNNITVNSNTIINGGLMVDTNVFNVTSNSITMNSTNITINTNITIGRTNISVNGTNLALINPTDNTIPYRLNPTALADSSLTVTDSSTVQGTNITAEGQLITDGAFATRSLSLSFADQNATNTITCANQSMVVIASLGTNATICLTADSVVIGQHLYIANYWTNASFSLFSGTACSDTNQLVVVRGGEWTPTETGETIHLIKLPGAWVEIGRSNPNGSAPGTINPTDGFLPYRADASSFGDSPLFRIDPNTVGVDTMDAGILVVTNLQSSGVVVSDTNGVVTSLFQGTGALTNDGSGNLGWSTNFTSSGGAGTNYFLQNAGNITITTNVVGTNVTWSISVPTTAITNHFLANGGNITITTNTSGTNVTWTISVPSYALSNYFLAAGTAVTLTTNVSGTNVTWTVNGTINSTDTAIPYRSNSTTFVDSPFRVFNTNEIHLKFNSLTNFVFNAADTNQPFFGITNGGGNFIHFGLNTGGQGIFSGSASSFQFTPTMLARTITPAIDNTYNNGGPSSGTYWATVGTYINYVMGFQSSTNYSRGIIQLANTNSDLTISTDANGTAVVGPPRPVTLQVGGTNMFKVDGTSGASTTGVLIYENGTAQRVTIGAADSGGAGFRVLRIPN